jgi:uncharacterized protein (TIGR03435 family)
MNARAGVTAILALGSALLCMAEGPPSAPRDAQANQRLTFDAASVKLAVVPPGITVSGGAITASRREDIVKLRNTGGPGTDDPGRIHYPLMSLRNLLGRAYDSYYEIKGPGWLDDTIVAVDATMPPATTKEQFREMLGNLIADRFGLKYHIETKEISGYTLVVAKSGPKLKESAAAAPQPNDEIRFQRDL